MESYKEPFFWGGTCRLIASDSIYCSVFSKYLVNIKEIKSDNEKRKIMLHHKTR